MNIVIIGGSKKFGRYLANIFQNKLRHKVLILSHRHLYGNYHVDIKDHHMFADYDDTINLLYKFDRLIENIDQIDIFIYCANYNGLEEKKSDYHSNLTDSLSNQWIKSLQINVVIPQDLIRRCLYKMNEKSKVVFFTTGLTLNPGIGGNAEYTHLASYAGTKSAQNFLMLAFANHNDKDATFFSISPHFDACTTEYYIDNEQEEWKYGLRIVDTILNSDKSVNGKILEIYHNREQ